MVVKMEQATLEQSKSMQETLIQQRTLTANMKTQIESITALKEKIEAMQT